MNIPTWVTGRQALLSCAYVIPTVPCSSNWRPTPILRTQHVTRPRPRLASSLARACVGDVRPATAHQIFVLPSLRLLGRKHGRS